MEIVNVSSNTLNSEGSWNSSATSLIIEDVWYTVVQTRSKLQDKFKSICQRSDKRIILKGIHMRLKSGEISAILGGSGSGKTSLLDVIANKYDGNISGQIYLNGKTLTPQVFKSKCGYVFQSDSLTSMPNLTAYETLWYIAQLKFRSNSEVSQHDIEDKVTSVMKDMKLWHVRDVKVGGLIVRGLSGGEKRRTCIAAQLLQDPDVLLLDEPTTGLDSFTAHDIIKTLSDLAHTRNKLVFITIHQPRSDIFQLLDTIGILSAGDMIYFGARNNLVSHFASVGHHCPEYSNPLDFAVDISSIDRRSLQQEYITNNRVDLLKVFYKNSTIYKDMISKNKDFLANSSRSGDAQYEQFRISIQRQVSSSKANSSNKFIDFTATMILLRRMIVNMTKDKPSFFIRGLQLPVFSFYILLFCGRLGFDASSIQDRSGVLYMSVSVAPMTGVLNSVTLFPSLMDQFAYESNDGLYGSGPFVMAYFIHIIPVHVVAALLYSTITYWSVGLYPEVDRFFKYFAVIVIGGYLGELLGVMLMGISKKSQLSQSISTLVVNTGFLLASGLVVATSSLILPLQWLTYISFLKYSSEILAVNEFNGLKFECEGPNTTDATCGDGNDFLNLFYPGAVDHENRNFGLLCVNIVVFWILNILIFHWRKLK